MRFKHILREEYMEDMQNFLKDMLVALKAHGVQEVGLEQIKDEMNSIGYDADEQFIIDYLSDTDLTSKIENDVVYLDVEGEMERYLAPDEEEKEQDHLRKKALSAIKKKQKQQNKVEKSAANQRDED